MNHMNLAVSPPSMLFNQKQRQASKALIYLIFHPPHTYAYTNSRFKSDEFSYI